MQQRWHVIGLITRAGLGGKRQFMKLARPEKSGLQHLLQGAQVEQPPAWLKLEAKLWPHRLALMSSAAKIIFRFIDLPLI